MNESTITAKGQTTVPADILQRIGGLPETRLLWHVLADGRVFIRVKNKTAADVKGIARTTNAKCIPVRAMRLCA